MTDKRPHAAEWKIVDAEAVAPVSAGVTRCNQSQCGDPYHAQVVALRLSGKRWQEIAHALGVRPETIWRWREACRHIDAAVSRESQDYLDSTRHALATALPKAAAAVHEIVEHGTYHERLAASKVLFDVFGRQDTPSTPADVLARLRAVERLPDADLDAKLAAGLARRKQQR